MKVSLFVLLKYFSTRVDYPIKTDKGKMRKTNSAILYREKKEVEKWEIITR